MRCQKTHEGDIPALSRLWKQAFGDTDEEIARFFREAYPHASGFAARDGETLVGMCFALPQQLACGEDTCSAAYLYAVATDEHWRGQGVCRTLLAFAEKELKKRGTDCLMLVPADEGLAAMYEKLGFSGALRRESRSRPSNTRACARRFSGTCRMCATARRGWSMRRWTRRFTRSGSARRPAAPPCASSRTAARAWTSFSPTTVCCLRWRRPWARRGTGCRRRRMPCANGSPRVPQAGKTSCLALTLPDARKQ